MARWRRLDRTRSLLEQIYGRARTAESHYTRAGRPKRAFATELEATAEADRLFAQGGRLARAYRCEICADWHIGGSGMTALDVFADTDRILEILGSKPVRTMPKVKSRVVFDVYDDDDAIDLIIETLCPY